MSAPQQLTEHNEIDCRQRTIRSPGPEMIRYWLLSTDDIRRIHERRPEHNRLGFAVQLCLHYPG
jgi:hypothetical protein